MLEVGPGTGYYTLAIAQQLTPDGVLDILDFQQKMLDRTMLEAEGRGITNIIPARGDAAALPYPDDSFDAAYTVAALGEIPQQEVALGEMRRVLKPGGRLVVGEILTDPHRVSLRALRERAERAGLRFEHRLGGLPGYYARFVA
jgi:ubiquinone/menaquinone biosynthesis C-methylase UbiE